MNQLTLSSDIDERIRQVREWRSETTELLRKKIEQLQLERAQMIASYDEEIAKYEMELKSLGSEAQTERPTEVGIKAYNYLLENESKSFSSSEIMSAIRCVGAVASVVLRPFIEQGKVRTEGGGRATRYIATAEGCLERSLGFETAV